MPTNSKNTLAKEELKNGIPDHLLSYTESSVASNSMDTLDNTPSVAEKENRVNNRERSVQLTKSEAKEIIFLLHQLSDLLNSHKVHKQQIDHN